MKLFFLIALVVNISIYTYSQKAYSASGKELSILHMEWAAANYAGENPGDPKLQFRATRASIDELLVTHENRGLIYVNDIDLASVNKTIEHLSDYLKSKGIKTSKIDKLETNEILSVDKNKITLVAFPGDIFRLKPPYTKTANLRHPEPSLLTDLMNLKSNKEDSKLIELANSSKQGLNIVTYYPVDMNQNSKHNWVETLRDDYDTQKLHFDEEEKYFDFSKERPGREMDYEVYLKIKVKNNQTCKSSVSQ